MTALREQRDGRQIGALTREDVVDALLEYARVHGPDFTGAAFNPATARWQRRPELIERYQAGRPDGRPWPSLNAIRKVMGSWDAAREAAGLPVNKPGPRRRASEDIPPDEIPDVRTRVVTRVTDRSRALQRELENARNREAAAKAREAAAKAKIDQLVAEIRDLRRDARTPVVDETRLRAARARARELKTELTNAQRREERARARVATLEAALADAKKHQKIGEKIDENISAPLAVIPAAIPAVNAQELARAQAEVARLTQAVAGADRRLELARDARRDWDRERESLRARAARTDAADQRAREAVASVRAADRRAEQAESALRELAEAVSGRRRRLTRDELQELRTTGPAGPAVMGDALKMLARARAGRGNLTVALTGVAEAALGWRDQVR